MKRATFLKGLFALPVLTLLPKVEATETLYKNRTEVYKRGQLIEVCNWFYIKDTRPAIRDASYYIMQWYENENTFKWLADEGVEIITYHNNLIFWSHTWGNTIWLRGKEIPLTLK